MPRCVSAAMIGSVPPPRTRSGSRPKTFANAFRPSWIAGDWGSTADARVPPAYCRSISAPAGAASRSSRSQACADRVDVLTRRQPDREVRLRGCDRRRVAEPRLAAEDPVHVHRRLRCRAQPELVRGALVVRGRPGASEHFLAARDRGPAFLLLRRGGNDPLPQRLGQASVAREDPAECKQQRVDRVQRRVAEHPGVKVAFARAHEDVEGQ